MLVSVVTNVVVVCEVVEGELRVPAAYMFASAPSEILEGGVDNDEGNEPLHCTTYPLLPFDC